MGIKLHQVPKTYNATPKRINRLANYITMHLKARQAKAQAEGRHFVIRSSDVADILEGFIEPK